MIKKQVETYAGKTREVSALGYKLMRNTGSPSFVGVYGDLMNRYDSGTLSRKALINNTLVEMVNEYSKD